jgi:hypothetical protein
MTEKWTRPRQEQTPSTTAKLKHPPCIKPEHMPDEIMTAFFDEQFDKPGMVAHLEAYAKSGVGWEEYRKKIPGKLLAKWVKVLKSCRRQGFIGPHVVDGEIVFRQLCESTRIPPVKYDLCSLCEKTCRLRDERGAIKNNTKPCWWEHGR